jgi:hypothetical protein
MQYLAFIWRVERTVRQPWQLALGVVALVATGWLVFQGLPRALEATLSASDATGGAFFLIAVSVFINLPHYVIDNVIWRFDDPQVQERLLAPAAR